MVVRVDEYGGFQATGECKIGGFGGLGSPIELRFVDPAGSMTGALFPTGHAEEKLTVNLSTGHTDVSVTLIDVANPFVLVDRATLPDHLKNLTPETPEMIQAVETIRRTAAVRFGLASTIEEAAAVKGTPKIVLLSAPEPDEDVRAQAYSMGKPHRSLQLTGAVCLGTAVCIPGTTAFRIAAANRASTIQDSVQSLLAAGSWPIISSSGLFKDVDHNAERSVVISHPSGRIVTGVKTRREDDGKATVEYGKVMRTARRLFDGRAIVYI